MPIKPENFLKKYQNYLIIAFMLVLAWMTFGKEKKENKKDKIEMKPIKQEETVKTQTRDWPKYLDTPKAVVRNVTEWQVPKRAGPRRVTEIEIDEEKLKKIAEIINPKLVEVEYGDEVNWLIRSKDGKEIMYFNKQQRVIGYVAERDKEAVAATIETEEAWRKMRSLITSFGIMPEGIEVKKESAKYVKVVYPIWEDTSREEAEGVEIRADYLVDEVLIKPWGNNMITAIYASDGKLIKLNLFLPTRVDEVEETEECWTKEEAEKLPEENFRILSTDRGGVGDEAGMMDEIKSINTDKAKMVYMYDAEKRGYIYPYILLEGRGRSGGKTAGVTLITRAIRQ